MTGMCNQNVLLWPLFTEHLLHFLAKRNCRPTEILTKMLQLFIDMKIRVMLLIYVLGLSVDMVAYISLFLFCLCHG